MVIIFTLLAFNTLWYVCTSVWDWTKIHQWLADMFLRWLYTTFLNAASDAMTHGVYYRITGRADEVELGSLQSEPVAGTKIDDHESSDTL